MSLRELEKELLAEKPWPLRGEVDAKSRPKDSLLDEHFKFTRRQKVQLNDAEAIDTSKDNEDDESLQKTSLAIETLIKQRICNNLFDNVVAIDKSLLEPQDATNLVDEEEAIDTEKAKTGLAEAYVPSSAAAKKAAQKLKEQTDEVLSMWNSLQRTLDSFCVDVHIPKSTIVRTVEERAEQDRVQAI